MPTWLEIALAVLLGLILVLFLGGLLGNARVRGRRERRLAQRIEEADHALAQARAEDRGWDRDALEAAARTAFEQRRPGVAIESLGLVQVVDRPGVEEDRALFHVLTAEGEESVELGRTGGEWTAI